MKTYRLIQSVLCALVTAAPVHADVLDYGRNSTTPVMKPPLLLTVLTLR